MTDEALERLVVLVGARAEDFAAELADAYREALPALAGQPRETIVEATRVSLRLLADRLRPGEATTFLRDLDAGGIDEERLRSEALAHHLPLDIPVVAVTASASAFGADPARVLGAVPLLAARADDRLLAIMPSRPPAGGEATLGIGPAVPPMELPAAFAEARLALQTAQAFGLAGAWDLADLGPRVLVALGGPAVAGLAQRHLAGLAGASPELEITVRTWLELDQRADAAGAALHLHPNSVRYRVARFEELTGLDLRRTHDVVLAWWLLESRRTP